MQIPSIKEIRQRKVVQWALAYLAGAWVVLQLVAVLGATYAWPLWLLRAVPVVLGVGFVAALVLAWYHGEKGAQTVSGAEFAILTTLLLIAGLGVMLVGGGEEHEASETEVTVPTSESAGVLAEPAADRAAVAVLPFEYIGAADESYFAAGLTDELLATMARVPGLKVAARTSAFAFEGSGAPADSIGRTLGVAHLVEGTVRRAGERVRVAAQLVDAATGFRVWAETYDRRVEDVFAVQEEIARAVARELRLRVGGDALAEAGTADAAAYAAVLRGRAVLERREGTRAAWTAEANRAFEDALGRDSAYAAAWAGLAHVRFQEAYGGITPNEDAGYAAAREAAERAITLHPNEGAAHRVLGNIALAHDRDYAAAAEHYERAIEANPSDAEAMAMLGWALAPLGRVAEAARAAERSIELDPLSVTVLNNAAAVYRQGRQPERALELWRAAEALEPDDEIIQSNLAFVFSVLGEHAEAVEHARRTTALDPDRTADFILAHVYARAGQRAEAERALQSVSDNDYETRVLVAWALGERDDAFSLLERGLAAGTLPVEVLQVDPLYDEMRGDPRWDVLLARSAEAGEN